MKHNRRYILIFIVVLVLGIVWLTRPQPLDELLDADKIESGVEATLMQSVEINNPDGSSAYDNIIIDFSENADSDAVQALLSVMSNISAQKRWKLPFENVLIYRTGVSNLSITFLVDGQKVDLVLLADNRTIYDVGIKDCSYKVDADAFEKLEAIIEKYGVRRDS